VICSIPNGAIPRVDSNSIDVQRIIYHDFEASSSEKFAKISIIARIGSTVYLYLILLMKQEVQRM